MNDKIPVDIDAVNAKLNSVSERARIKHEEEERRRAEEAARLAEEREDRLTEKAAQLRDQFYEMFSNVDLTDASSTESTIGVFEQCLQVLAGQQSAPVPTPIPTPAPVVSTVPDATSEIPFDWDSRSENQKKVIKLVADNELTSKRLAVLETVLTAPANRFYIRPSGALGDGQAKDLDKTYKDAQAAASLTESETAPATQPASAPTPVPSPANMPARKPSAKKAVAAPAQPSASTQPPETAQPSSDGTAETGSLAKKQSFTDRAKAAGKNFVKKLD